MEIILLKLQEQKFHSLSIIFGKKDQTLIKTISFQVIFAIQVWTMKVRTASHPNYILTFSSAKFFVRSIFLGANVYF